MWPPNAILPRSAAAVLNGRCRARLDMSQSSLGVVLRGLPARGRSVTFPVWRKRCIFSNNELISNRFAVFVTCTHILFIYVYMTGCVKCYVYFSTFVLANESWFCVCRVLSFIFYWFGMDSMCVQVTKTANRFEISSLLEKILLKQVRWCLTFVGLKHCECFIITENYDSH
jgi:hypothetical protein